MYITHFLFSFFIQLSINPLREATTLRESYQNSLNNFKVKNNEFAWWSLLYNSVLTNQFIILVQLTYIRAGSFSFPLNHCSQLRAIQLVPLVCWSLPITTPFYFIHFSFAIGLLWLDTKKQYQTMYAYPSQSCQYRYWRSTHYEMLFQYLKRGTFSLFKRRNIRKYIV